MRARVGLALAHDAVRAVVVRQGKIVWGAEVRIEDKSPLEDVIRTLLDEAPAPRWPRPMLCAAVGPHASQVKLVGGLPKIADPNLITKIIRENAGSFFLKNGVPLITTGARAIEPGIALAAALDLPSVKAIRNASRTRGWRLGFIAPTAVALPLVVEDTTFSWTDGRITLDVVRADQALQSVRARPVWGAQETPPPPHPIATLTAFGEQALRYADAYGSTILDSTNALALDPDDSALWNPRETRRRLLGPAILLMAGIGAFALSPLAGSLTAMRAKARLDKVPAGQWHVVVSALDQLDRVTRMLQDLHDFAGSRSSTAQVLGDLARVLPSGSVLESLEIEEGHALVQTVTRDPSAVLAAIQGVPGFVNVGLRGAVTREAAMGQDLRHVTIQFRIDAVTPLSGSAGGRP